jgi:hypothetical protein
MRGRIHKSTISPIRRKKSSGFLHFGAIRGQSPRLRRYITLDREAPQWIGAGFVQAFHAIGQPHDRYESEANRVADEVLRMPASDGIEADAQSTGAVRPLSESVRAHFESRFGYDFSGVRIHADSRAAAAAASIGAKAFTSGRDVVFAAGRYAPGTDEGRRILAHELTHVVQQNRTLPRLPMQGAVNNHETASRPVGASSMPSIRLTSPLMIQRDCQHFNAGWIHPRTGNPAPAGTWCETEADARARAVACPSDCFIYDDGPASHPYREIPGFPCAHYVAHQLGITTGPRYARCQLGFSVMIPQIVQGRQAFPLAQAQVNDIWSDGGHSGVIIGVDPANNRVRIRACSIWGAVYRSWEHHGNAYR